MNKIDNSNGSNKDNSSYDYYRDYWEITTKEKAIKVINYSVISLLILGMFFFVLNAFAIFSIITIESSLFEMGIVKVILIKAIIFIILVIILRRFYDKNYSWFVLILSIVSGTMLAWNGKLSSIAVVAIVIFNGVRIGQAILKYNEYNKEFL